MKKNKSQFASFIQKRQYEDLDTILTIEKLLIKKRKKILTIPKPNTPVVLLLSGGIDSTTAWLYLTKELKLDVYPLYFRRGHKRWIKEKKAVDYYYSFFVKNYPYKFNKPKEYSVYLPPKEVEDLISNPKEFFHPQVVINEMKKRKSSGQSLVVDVQGPTPYLFPFFGMLYAKELEYNKNLKVRHVFNCVALGDGHVVPSQTYTALRSTMLSMCALSADWSWNFSSIALDNELGNYLSKADLIKYAYQNNLPLDHTWSCYNSGLLQCGDNCLTCNSRRKEFKAAGVIDKTKYLCNYKVVRNINNVVQKII